MKTHIPPSVQRQWLRELHVRWRQINLTSLNAQLRAPQIELDFGDANLGRWDPLTRTISISTNLILGCSAWAEVEETLKHEMAHQVVSELFAAEAPAPHGGLFAKACEMLGIIPTRTGALTPEQEKIRDRVHKLLALSTSSNPHEAQSAMAAANRLLLKHNIELGSDQDVANYEWRYIGAPSGRVSLERKLLSGILQQHFFVSCVWTRSKRIQDGKDVSMLQALGTRDNLDLAEYAHDYLVRTLDGLWKDYRTQHGGGRAVRNEFRVGVLMGFREHLDHQSKVNEAQGLIWMGDPRMDELTGQRFPRLRSMRTSRYRVGKAHFAGRAEGQELRIRPGVRGGKRGAQKQLTE